MAKRSAPEVNAGSMADIAFLLLIFFLVTTTIEKDSGINRKLPPIEELEEDVVIKQKNIFTVLLNGKDQLLVEEDLMELKDLRAETSYAAYISVQNELVAAYNELRNRRGYELGSKEGFKDMNFVEMQKNYKDARFIGNKVKLKAVIDQIKLDFPQKLSEAQ